MHASMQRAPHLQPILLPFGLHTRHLRQCSTHLNLNHCGQIFPDTLRTVLCAPKHCQDDYDVSDLARWRHDEPLTSVIPLVFLSRWPCECLGLGNAPGEFQVRGGQR